MRTPSAVMRGGNAMRAARAVLRRANALMREKWARARVTARRQTRARGSARRASRAARANDECARVRRRRLARARAGVVDEDRRRPPLGDVDQRAWTRARICEMRRRGRARHSRVVVARAGPNGRDSRFISREEKELNRENAKTWLAVGSAALAMTVVVAAVYENSSDGFLYGVDSIESYASGDGLDFVFASDGGPALSAASVAGAAIWGLALYFASPVSVIMLFLGRTDSERPSDWLLRKVTGIAQMEDASVGAKVAVAAWFLVAGVAASVVGDAAFGDSTWQISSGLGFLTIAGVSELGRPKRVDEATLAKLTAQYDDFCEFAQNRLSRSGRAHQTEISRAFRDAYPQHDESVLDESEFRSLVANWHPAAERSPRGYYKNLSLVKSERVSVKDLGV